MLAGDADSGLATCSDLPSCSEVFCPSRRPPAPTLKQHYYPEGGWGWLIVFIAVAVQILTHGLHQAAGVLLPEVNKHFPTASYLATGKYHLGYCTPFLSTADDIKLALFKMFSA